MVDATVELNSRSWAAHPPARKQHPRTYACQPKSLYGVIMSRLGLQEACWTECCRAYWPGQFESGCSSKPQWTPNACIVSTRVPSHAGYPTSFPLTMSSTAFPNVALHSPPNVWPNLADSSSVAKLKREASGTMAMKLRMKTAVGLHPSSPAMMPMGTKTRRTLT